MIGTPAGVGGIGAPAGYLALDRRYRAAKRSKGSPYFTDFLWEVMDLPDHIDAPASPLISRTSLFYSLDASNVITVVLAAGMGFLTFSLLPNGSPDPGQKSGRS